MVPGVAKTLAGLVFSYPGLSYVMPLAYRRYGSDRPAHNEISIRAVTQTPLRLRHGDHAYYIGLGMLEGERREHNCGLRVADCGLQIEKGSVGTRSAARRG